MTTGRAHARGSGENRLRRRSDPSEAKPSEACHSLVGHDRRRRHRSPRQPGARGVSGGGPAHDRVSAYAAAQLRRLLTEQEDVLVAALPRRPRQAADRGVRHRAVVHDQRDRPRRIATSTSGCSRREGASAGRRFRPGIGHGRCVEPLGLVLVIAPWNYPVQLLLAPLVGGARGRQHGGAQAVRGGAGDVGGARRADPAVPRLACRRRGRPGASPRRPRCSPSASTTSSTRATARSGAS